MPREYRKAPLFTDDDYNVAFGVILDNPTASKLDLATSILGALHAADRKVFVQADAFRMIQNLGKRQNVVQDCLPRKLRGVRLYKRLAGHLEFRIADSFEGKMSDAVLTRWKAQLNAAKAAAVVWEEKHKRSMEKRQKNLKKVDPAKHRAAARMNLVKANEARLTQQRLDKAARAMFTGLAPTAEREKRAACRREDCKHSTHYVGHLHCGRGEAKAGSRKRKGGTRPRGRGPKGKRWDTAHGWVDKDAGAGAGAGAIAPASQG